MKTRSCSLALLFIGTLQATACVHKPGPGSQGPKADRSLELERWSLISALGGTPAGRRMSNIHTTLVFKSGKLTASLVCGTFIAPYTRQGNRVKIGPGKYVRAVCAHKVLPQQDPSVIRLLGGITTLKIKGRRLQLLTKSGDGLDLWAQ